MDGLYCGDDGLGLDPNTLYKCAGGAVVSSQPCSGACEIFPSGTNDECVGGSCRYVQKCDEELACLQRFMIMLHD